jgi:hypothetical protein
MPKRSVVATGGACLAVAAGSLALPAVPTYDPWAWVVFGREIVGPGPGLSTISGTGWKPLAVLFTAPLGLFGAAAPSLWLVVVRCAGLIALVLAFRLAARAGGVVAGAIAALALLACSTWLRFLWAGNVEPLVVALVLGAIELHLRGRRQAAFALVALAALGRPEAWTLAGGYAAWLWWRDGRRWPLAVGVPAMVALWVGPDWLGSGDPLHVLHSAQGSGEAHGIQQAAVPVVELVRRTAGLAAVPVWIGTVAALVLGRRTRDRTVGVLALAAAAWTVPTLLGALVGYPAVPRYFVAPLALCCVLAGIGLAGLARLPHAPRARTAVAVALAAAAAPFVLARADGLEAQAAQASSEQSQLSSLWQAADRARLRDPNALLHPVVEPGAMANGLAWKLELRLHDVAGAFWPGARIAFLEGNDRAVLARLRRRHATATPLTAAGRWHVVLVRWAGRSRRRAVPRFFPGQGRAWLRWVRVCPPRSHAGSPPAPPLSPPCSRSPPRPAPSTSPARTTSTPRPLPAPSRSLARPAASRRP